MARPSAPRPVLPEGRDVKAVCVDLTSVGPDSGGVARVATGIVRELGTHGLAVQCLTSPGTTDTWRERLDAGASVEVTELRVALRADSRWQSLLRRALPTSLKGHRLVGAVRRKRSRAVRLATTDDTVWYPFHRALATARSSVITVHDLRVFEPELASPMDQRIIRDNVAHAMAVICSWPHPYAHLLTLFPEAADKTFLVPLPVLNAGAPSDRAISADERVRLFYPGFITPHKNHEILIRALPELPSAEVTFVGGETAGHAAHLRRLAEDLGVAERIVWRGYVSSHELDLEFDRAHILVMPTRWEAASGPVFEAVVRHLPFVASDIAPIRAQLEYLGLAAPLFDPDEPSGLVDAIRACVASYADQRAALLEPAERLRDRTWADTAGDYARILGWAASGIEYPSDLKGRTP